jgi:hypothetical protein
MTEFLVEGIKVMARDKKNSVNDVAGDMLGFFRFALEVHLPEISEVGWEEANDFFAWFLLTNKLKIENKPEWQQAWDKIDQLWSTRISADTSSQPETV